MKQLLFKIVIIRNTVVCMKTGRAFGIHCCDSVLKQSMVTINDSSTNAAYIYVSRHLVVGVSRLHILSNVPYDL